MNPSSSNEDEVRDIPGLAVEIMITLSVLLILVAFGFLGHVLFGRYAFG